MLHPAYVAMRLAAKRLRWPEAFRTDLTKHDRAALAPLPPGVKLFWVLRRCGTYLSLVTREPIDGAGHYAWHAPHWFPRTFGEGNYRFFTWDGRALREHDCDASTMADILREMAHEETAPQAVGF